MAREPSDDAVQVAVRVRPLNAREKAVHLNPALPSWQLSPSSITQSVNQKPVLANCFSFDHVFQPGVQNLNVFDAIAKPVVASAIDGINGVIFAYGQTAAGKTYTMLGTDADAGITPRSISNVFQLIAQCSQRQFLLRASYIEIYNEIIRDLLLPANDNLRIHEDVINKRVFVDAREEVVVCVDDVMRIIAAGEAVRAVGETNMNDRSSRSHTIFTLKIESRETTSDDADEDALNIQNEGVAIRASTLSLVDLAGSERASFTKAQGMRLVEGGHINKSLLTLGTVINKLSSGVSRNASHIPYRDSKLTRLLQPALGGNARTAIICAITPSTLHMDETLSTLKFASRAKKVTNHAQTNEFLDDRAKLRRAEKKIVALELELQKFKAGGGAVMNQIQPLQPLSTEGLGRIRANEGRFDKLLAHLMQNGLLQPEKPVITRTPGDMTKSVPLRSALDLRVPQQQPSPMGINNVDLEHEQQLTEMRLKLMRAEQERNRALLEIEFERRAMDEEVGALIASNEQATRDRLISERECEEALNSLARSQAASLVNEMVSDAINTSSLTSEVKEANRKLSVMDAIKKENDTFKKEMAVLQKDLSEIRRREKRGVGPVMKEVRQEHNKRVEAESKLKAIRKQLQTFKTEKASMIRDRNDMERKMKALTMENERHRSHTEKAQSRIERVVSEAKKELQATLDEKNKELSTALEDLSSATTRRDVLEKQVTVLMETNAKLSSDVSSRTDEKECAEEEIVRLQNEINLLQEKIQNVESYSSGLTEQLGKVHLDLEEKKSELEEALRTRSETEQTELLTAQQAFVELEVRFLQGEKTICSLKDSLKECEQEKIALQQKTMVLETEVAEHVRANENLRSKLKTSEEAKSTAEAETASVRKNMSYEIEQLQICLESKEEAKRTRQRGLEESLELRTRLEEMKVQMEDMKSRSRESCEENEELRRKVGLLLSETETRMRELNRMAGKLRSRDEKIFELEETLSEFGRGEGLIANLRKRICSKDTEIDDLRLQLRMQSELLRDQDLAAEYKDVEEFLKLKTWSSCLERERDNLQKRVDVMEKEKVELIQETFKLRKRIKLHDGERIESAIKRKVIEREHFSEECRRKKVLRELDTNNNIVKDSA
ncbi:Kinesin motor [Gracilaria domingensis]|nr:Kinesin motor [Gracilaria domingensis]